MLQALEALLPRSTKASSSSTLETRRSSLSEEASTVHGGDGDTLVFSPTRKSVASSADSKHSGLGLRPLLARPKIQERLDERMPAWREIAIAEMTSLYRGILCQLVAMEAPDTSFATIKYQGGFWWIDPSYDNNSRLCKTYDLLRNRSDAHLDLPAEEIEQLIKRCWGDLVAVYAKGLCLHPLGGELSSFARTSSRGATFDVVDELLTVVKTKDMDETEYLYEHFVEPVMSAMAQQGRVLSLPQAQKVLVRYCDRLQKRKSK